MVNNTKLAMDKKVLCQAPLTAVLVDTNKGVRPCCVYDNNYIGNIKEQTISSIIKSEEWQKLKQNMYDNVWPDPCLPCKERERVSGWSVRELFQNGSFDITGWEEEKLTYLEFNGSNICNLSCLHCNAGFSSRWVAELKKTIPIYNSYDKEKRTRLSWMDAVIVYDDDERGRSSKMHLPDPDLILKNLKELDLSGLRTINFKGGEPLLNSETVTILEYLDSQNILKNINITMSSNGTYVNEKIIELFKKCKNIIMYISIDGIGDLFNYIRYGDAKFEDIEPTLAKLNEIPNISIGISTAVMNYNIFNLLDIKNWVIEMSKKYNKVNSTTGFSNCVADPKYLSLRTLTDPTREKLSKFYKELNGPEKEFDAMIQTLNSDYAGDEMHNQWIEYTELMETVRGNNILDIVPELKDEMRFRLYGRLASDYK
jgi:radical SAM protein with 4Fe4S-binding SPASM domain